MKAILRNVVLALGAIALLASCDLFKKDEVFVSISSDSPSFVDGKLTLKVSVSPASSKDVAVTLSDSGNIPAGALSYTQAFTIPAGTASANVDVTVDVDLVPAGVYSVTFAIAEANGAKIDPNAKECAVSLSVAEQAPPQVFISNSSEAFVDGKAKFTVSLDRAIKENVTVDFEVLTDVEGYLPIAAEALSFSNPATIPAGSTSAEVEVTLDESKVMKGVSQYAVIAIKSAVNAELAGAKTKAYIEANIELKAKQRSDWTVSYEGDITEEGVIYSGVKVSGIAEGQNYYLFVYNKGVVAQYFPETGVAGYLQFLSEDVMESMGTEDAYEIQTGNDTWLYDRLAVGAYEAWIVGCDAEGFVTGEYGTGEFTIEPNQAQKDAYDKWLGEWNIKADAIKVVEKDRSQVSFTVYTKDYYIDAALDADANLNFFVTDPCADGGNVGFFGYLPSEQEGYISIYSGDEPIGCAKLSEDGTQATIESTLNGTFTGMAAFTYQGDSFTGWGSFDVEFPAVMKRPQQASENYLKWIGTWKIEGFDNPLSIIEYVANESYAMGLFYPGVNSTIAIVDYDSESGNLLFNFGTSGGAVTSGENTYYLYLSGITNNNYVATGNKDTDLLARAVLSSDGNSASIEANSYLNSNNEETYAVQLGLLGYNSDSGWTNFGMIFAIPTTMTRQTENSAPAATARPGYSNSLPSGRKVAGAAMKAGRKLVATPSGDVRSELKRQSVVR